MWQVREKIRMHIQFLVRISEENRPLARTRRMCENNIKMDVTKVGWARINWIHLAQDRDQCFDILE
jgi:hypothetical protein